MKVLCRLPVHGWMLQIEFKLQDLWLGVFWKNTAERLDIWVCLLPCFPIHYASPVDDHGDDIP